MPNVKHVHMKSLIEIAKDLNLLQERGAKGSLTLEDFAHGTFSLSNIGVVCCIIRFSKKELFSSTFHFRLEELTLIL